MSHFREIERLENECKILRSAILGGAEVMAEKCERLYGILDDLRTRGHGSDFSHPAVAAVFDGHLRPDDQIKPIFGNLQRIFEGMAPTARVGMTRFLPDSDEVLKMEIQTFNGKRIRKKDMLLHRKSSVAGRAWDENRMEIIPDIDQCGYFDHSPDASDRALSQTLVAYPHMRSNSKEGDPNLAFVLCVSFDKKQCLQNSQATRQILKPILRSYCMRMEVEQIFRTIQELIRGQD